MAEPVRQHSKPRQQLPSWLPLGLSVVAVLISTAALVVTVSTRTGGSPSTADRTTWPGAACDSAEVAAKTMPSVVTLFVRSDSGTGSNGSGEFVDTAGHVLTNNHVISSAVAGGTVTVVRPNGEELPATIVGRDPKTDLAVVKVTPVDPVQPVTFGTVPAIGSPVFAIGAPLGLAETFTAGVVSGLGRSVRVPADDNTTALLVSAIQTDASINPGNSGGMLADCSAALVGVPTAGATASDSRGYPVAGSIGLGFAVPAATAQRIAETLIAEGNVTHADFGIAVVPVMGPASTVNPSGLYITAVVPGGAAAQARLRHGDIITSLDGQPVSSADQLQEISLTNAPGTSVTVQYERDDQTRTAHLVLT